MRPTKLIVPRKVPYLSVCCSGLVGDHVNDHVSDKLGGVVREMGAIHPSPPFRVPTKGGCLVAEEGNLFSFLRPLHRLWDLVSLTIWSYTLLQHDIVDVKLTK